MAIALISSTVFILTLIFQGTLAQGKTETTTNTIFEDGYTVSTVFNGDKSNFKVNPRGIVPQYPSSDHLFILLDSVASTFYTLSLPTSSNNIVIEKLAGNVEPKYVDGDLDSARFSNPRSFAFDYSGNVYVADYRNHAIRKITNSGVTTIAGGNSQKPGRADGPARNASFSNDFELTFVPGRCALMISDHGNRLIRQINLKSEDCTTKKHSGSVLGATSAWILGVAFSCLFGVIIGLVIRPYIIPYDGPKTLQPHWTWKHYPMSLVKQTMMLCSDIRSAVVKSTVYSLFWRLIILNINHLSHVFKLRMVDTHASSEKSVSLLDCDDVHTSSTTISPKVYRELNDLNHF